MITMFAYVILLTNLRLLQPWKLVLQSLLCRGGSKPNHATALKVADYFGVPVSELTGEKEKAPTQEGDREIGFDDFTYAFYEESKDLPDEKKKMLLEMARFMKADIEKEKG